MPKKSWTATPPTCSDSRDHPNSANRKNQNETHAQSDSQLLGRLGRVEHGRNGLVHLFARPGPRVDGIIAPLWNSRDARERWLLRRYFLHVVFNWLWHRTGLGPDC